MESRTITKALQAVQDQGALLVFPVKNQNQPASLWRALHPRTKMRWEWDEEGDGKLFALWRLREQLSCDKRVVYGKWYRGRATFFSREVFVLLLACLRTEVPLSQQAQRILETLRSDSPLSPKQLRAITELQGKWLEPTYQRAMKELWQRLWIVGFGEIEDSSFPSLAVGATQNLYEDLWAESQKISSQQAAKSLGSKLGENNPFYQWAMKRAMKWTIKPPAKDK